MKESNKTFIKDAFGSLFSNDNAISCAKTSPVWLTIILFVLAVFFPVIPIMVNNANSYGSSFISTYDFGFQKTMPKLALDMAKENKSLVIDENHLLSISQSDDEKVFAYTNEVTGKIEMEIILSTATTDERKNAFITSVTNDRVQVLTEADPSNNIEKTYYHPSFCILFKNGIYTKIYAPNSNTPKTYSALGNFETFDKNTNLLDVLLTVDGQKFAPKTDLDIRNILAKDENVVGIYNNWKHIFDKSYETIRTYNTWVGSSIYLGIFAGLSLVMCFLLWILTRGKKNPFNYLSLFACYKIGSWLSVCPGLIGLVLGFLMPQYSTMIFIMALGMRTMWVSTKQLRPQIQ